MINAYKKTHLMALPANVKDPLSLLHKLAYAFYATGNNRVSDQLSQIHESIGHNTSALTKWAEELKPEHILNEDDLNLLGDPKETATIHVSDFNTRISMLELLAESFRMIGNHHVGDTIFQISNQFRIVANHLKPTIY